MKIDKTQKEVTKVSKMPKVTKVVVSQHSIFLKKMTEFLNFRHFRSL